uniref:Uncharacterized protein n=1 Tax=Oryza glumipatula TaxID=40148 RepID=A0A0E0ALN2_9ORYZ
MSQRKSFVCPSVMSRSSMSSITPDLSTNLRRASRSASSSPNSVTGSRRMRRRRTTSCRGRSSSSIRRSSERSASSCAVFFPARPGGTDEEELGLGFAAEDWAGSALGLLGSEPAAEAEEVAGGALERSWRCSSWRRFWSCFCSSSDRRTKLFPPKSAVAAFRFFSSSLFRRSIAPATRRANPELSLSSAFSPPLPGERRRRRG